MSTRAVIRFGGICLAGGAVAFLGVFAYLAARFNYPDVLDGPAATVLPSLLATGRLVGMFRNVTGAVAPIAAVNNYLLPAFMIILGVAFVRWTAVPGSAGA